MKCVAVASCMIVTFCDISFQENTRLPLCSFRNRLSMSSSRIELLTVRQDGPCKRSQICGHLWRKVVELRSQFLRLVTLLPFMLDAIIDAPKCLDSLIACDLLQIDLEIRFQFLG